MADAKKPAAKKSASKPTAKTPAKKPAAKKPAKKPVDLYALRVAWNDAQDNTAYYERLRARADSTTASNLDHAHRVEAADKELQAARDAETKARERFLKAKNKAEKAARK